ncbi:MAG: hypothetical protein ACUVQW_00365 [Candidatus Bathycorpusculaceae bacterium]
MSKKENFKKVLLEAVDEGLLTLGESGREAVYFHLKNLYNVKKEEIPFKLEEFAEGLRKIFGLGAAVIEKAIIKSLYDKIGMKYEERKGRSFLAYVIDAEKVVEESSLK